MNHIRLLIIEESQIDVDIVSWEMKRRELLLDYLRVDSDLDISATILEGMQVIVSNHKTPSLNSVQALKKSRKILPNIPFIVFSFCVPNDIQDLLVKNAVTAIISKENFDALYRCITSPPG